MSEAYDFLKECGVFFVLTVNGDYPTGRPFGAHLVARSLVEQDKGVAHLCLVGTFVWS